MGRISPLDGVGPGDLTIADLLERIDHPARNTGGEPVREVVLALNPTLEADGTALYLAQQLASRKNIRVTRLARGIPTGTQLEYANKAVLADAIEGRQPMS
jgi:recombination protein RecR